MELRAERRITGREMNAIFVVSEHGAVEVTMAAVGTFDCTPYERWLLRYSYTAELYALDGVHVLVVTSSETGGEHPSERTEVHVSRDGGRTWQGEGDEGSNLRNPAAYAELTPVATLEG